MLDLVKSFSVSIEMVMHFLFLFCYCILHELIFRCWAAAYIQGNNPTYMRYNTFCICCFIRLDIVLLKIFVYISLRDIWMYLVSWGIFGFSVKLIMASYDELRSSLFCFFKAVCEGRYYFFHRIHQRSQLGLGFSLIQLSSGIYFVWL